MDARQEPPADPGSGARETENVETQNPDPAVTGQLSADSTPMESRKLRLAVEASGEVIFMTDARGTITYVNPEFVRLYGYAPSELIGRTTPRVLKSGLTPQDDYATLWAALRSRQVVRREFVNRTKTGETVIVESSANPIVLDGELVGFLAVQRDITARKATEAKLRESESRYRALAEAAEDSIFIVERNDRIQYANSVTSHRFGIRVGDAIGTRLQDVFPHEMAGEMRRDLARVFATGEKLYVENQFQGPAGQQWMGTWLVPMSFHAGEPQAVLGVARDITDRKRLERQFAESQKMEAIGRLAGGIAHDFNNLLTAILGYSDLLLQRLRSDSDAVADLNEIKKAGERAGRLTRQLLTFSRRQAFSPKVLDLNEVITDLQKMLERLIGEDILLDVATDPDLAHAKADPSQMEQLIVNLVVNARDAMPRGGTLRIATANAELDADFARRHEGVLPGRYVALTIQDSGCGMTPDVLSHAFEPFFTTKPPGKGTGLGLSTVYGIVQQTNGYITITSEPGRGTTVTTYIPVSMERAHAPSPETVPRRAPTGGETILLVEDEPGVRRLIDRTLRAHGYNVLEAGTVADAITLAKHHHGPIHLLLSDVVMPGMNGPDLAQRIVCLRPEIKVLYVSGFTTLAGFDGGSVSPRMQFLGKPFTPRVLAAKVRECLDLVPVRAEAHDA